MTDKRRNNPRNSDATHRQSRSQKTSQRQSRSGNTASQPRHSTYPPRRPSNPESVERTLRSSERINRIREQGAKRTQVQPPRQPVNQAKKKQSQSASNCPVSKPERNQNASMRGVRPSSSRAEIGSQRPSSSARTASRQNDALPRNRVNAVQRQIKPNRPRHSSSALGQSHLAKGIYSQREVSGNRPSTRGGLGRASNAGARATSSHKKVTSFNKIAVACVALLAILVFCGVDGLINGNKIYEGVAIGDVAVGGLTKDEAVDRVSGEYSQRVSSNVATFFTTQDNLDNPKNSDTDANIEEQISYEESLSNRTQWTIPSNEVEATLDIDSLVEQAFEVGRSDGSIFGRIGAGIFGKNIPLICSYNDEKITSLSDQMTSAVGKKRINFGISINNGVASVTDGNDGNEVTTEWLTSHLNETFLGTEPSTKTVLETQYMPLQANENDAKKAADTVNASIAAGASFVYGDQTWNASSSDLGNLITTNLLEEGKDHWVLTPVFDDSKTKNALFSSLHSNIDSDGLQVSFAKDGNGQIVVSSNAKGTAPVASDVMDELNTTFFVSETRTQAPQISVPSADIPSSLSFEDAKSFGLITDISSFTTQYSSGNEARVNNIHTAADLLSGSIAKANGGSWSFNDIAGEATPDKGYQAAGAIVGGEYSDAVGGGICQVATTVFNSVYLAGYPIEKRYNHTLYIESYPKGRDAAIAYPDLDLVWKNDTTSDVLLMMSYTSTSVTATLWGVDPEYQVSTEYGEWKKGEPYSTTYKTDNTVASGKEYVKTTGVDGSSITIVRTVKDHEGKILHEDSFTSTYAPKNKVIVKGTA